MHSGSGPQEGTQEPVAQGGSSAAPHQAALVHSVVGAVCWPTPSTWALGVVKAMPCSAQSYTRLDCWVGRKCLSWIWGHGTRPEEKP